MKRIISFVTTVILWMIYFQSTAIAAQAGGETDSVAKGAIALASGLAIAIAAFGAALGQGKMAATAMESIGRNPNAADKLFTPLLLGLAFIEALAIYALLIAFLLQLKLYAVFSKIEKKGGDIPCLFLSALEVILALKHLGL